MRKTGFLCVLGVALATGPGGSALADVCGDLQARLTSLEMAERAAWDAPDPAADPVRIERERTAVLRALAANRCRSPVAKRDKRPNRIFAGLFGGRRSTEGRREGRFFGEGPFGRDLTSGTYRTLCVRSCDGYYFPISFAAGGRDLARDENACRALCPGQAVALYVQPSPTSEGGPMVSLAGEPYAGLATAFRYRTTYDRDCDCGPIDPATAAAFSVFAVPAPGPSSAPPGAAGPGWDLPAPPLRLVPDDPETMANRAGGLATGPVQRVAEDGVVYREGPDGKVVRMVGPAAPYFTQ